MCRRSKGLPFRRFGVNVETARVSTSDCSHGVGRPGADLPYDFTLDER